MKEDPREVYRRERHAANERHRQQLREAVRRIRGDQLEPTEDDRRQARAALRKVVRRREVEP